MFKVGKMASGETVYYRGGIYNMFSKVSFYLITTMVCMIIYQVYLKGPSPLPVLDIEEWWGSGPGPTDKVDESIRPFKIQFSQEMIRELKDRINARPNFTPPLENVGFQYGFNSKALEDWLEYWANNYNFTERAEFLNQYPHFKTKIQGLDIHFIRVRPESVPSNVEVLPMLMLHGFPGSVREFYEAIPHLTAVSKDRDFALELIIPSLPGYGFSDGPVRPGLSPAEIGGIMKNLMNRLGFEKYFVQGGDWGAQIGEQMATYFPDDVLGFHTNMAVVISPTATVITMIFSAFPSLIVDPKLVDRMYPLNEKYSATYREVGYLHIQSTKPDTVGLALLDSPAGLLAYIIEKFSTWTRPDLMTKPDGGLDYRFSKDQLLDNLMMYWNSKCIVTSMRLYAETFNKKKLVKNLEIFPTMVPTWALQAKYELSYFPPWMLKMKYPYLVGTSPIDDGGHFVAFELPQVFADDVLTAVEAIMRWRDENLKTEL